MDLFAVLDAPSPGWPHNCSALKLAVLVACAAGSVFFVLGRGLGAAEAEQLEQRLAKRINDALTDKREAFSQPFEELQQALSCKVDCVQLDLHVEILQSRINEVCEAADHKIAEALRQERRSFSKTFSEKVRSLAERFDERVDGLMEQFEREAIGRRLQAVEQGLAEARIELVAAETKIRLRIDDADCRCTELSEAVERLEKRPVHEDPTVEAKADSPDRMQQLENIVGRLVSQMHQHQGDASTLESFQIALEEKAGVVKTQEIEKAVHEALQKKAGSEEVKQLQEKLDGKITDQMRLLREKLEEKPGLAELESLRAAFSERIDAAQVALEEKAGVRTVRNLKAQVEEALRAEKGSPDPESSKAKQLRSAFSAGRDAFQAGSSGRDTLSARLDHESVTERFCRSNVTERLDQLRREVRAGAASGPGSPQQAGGDASGGLGRMSPQGRLLGQPLRYGHFGVGPGSPSAAQTGHFY